MSGGGSEGGNPTWQKVKQDVIIADRSSTAKVSLWEEHVNAMKEHKSYCLKNFIVREFQSTKYLSMCKENTEIILIDDIGVVVERSDDEDEISVIKNVTIIGVPHLDKYKACLQCKARVETQTPPLGRCSKVDCMMMQSTFGTSRLNFCSCTTMKDNKKLCNLMPTVKLFVTLLVLKMCLLKSY